MFYNRLHKETKVLKDATFTYRLHPNLQGPDGQRIDRQQPTVLRPIHPSQRAVQKGQSGLPLRVLRSKAYHRHGVETQVVVCDGQQFGDPRVLSGV